MNNPSTEAIDLFEQAAGYDDGTSEGFSIRPSPPVPDKYAHFETDRVRAKALYLEAAKLGHVDAMFRLAFYYGNGFGREDDSFGDEHDKAFYWLKEAARYGDVNAINGVAMYYLSGIFPERDPVKGEYCLIQAAKRGFMVSQITLAELDLGLFYGAQSPESPPHKIERGLRLLEDAALQEGNEALLHLGRYYAVKDLKPLIAEYYDRRALISGISQASSRLRGGYRSGAYGEENAHLSPCIDALKPDEFSRLEELCPRVGGPLTRERVGLPSAPTEPLDVEEYLDDFERKYGEPK